MNKKLVVIGGGPAGHAAAMEAAGSGMEVILVEKENMGGTCLNKGCVPTKIYLQAIRAAEQVLRFGIELKNRDTQLLIKKLKEIRDEVIGRLQYGSIFAVEKKGVKIIEGTAHITGEKTVEITYPEGGKEIIEADFVLLATGSVNRESKKADNHIVHTLDEIIMLNDIPEEISIMGGGVLGVETAVILSYLDVKVHLIEEKNRILPSWDEEISNQMSFYLKERNIDVITGSKEPVSRDMVFCSGREVIMPPGTDGIREADSNSLCIKNGWLYGAGDCISYIKDASAAIHQGRMAVKEMLGRDINDGKLHVSNCIYTPLEAAMTGKTEHELQKEGIAYETHFHSVVFTAVGMIGELSQGFIKVIAQKDTGKLLGFHVMSPEATEIIMTCHVALECGMTAQKFSEMVFPHPTESEQLKEAVMGLVEKLDEI